MFFNLCLYIFFSSGKIHYTEIFDMLRNIDPPLGFGKKCPERLAYKKLIRMNMPMDFEGKVRKLFLFASTSAIQNLIYLHFSSCKHFHRVSKFEQAIKILPFAEKKIYFVSLSHYIVTLLMLQCQPNRLELRSEDSYIQILCTVFPHIVDAATILFWIHKSLKISYSFLFKFSLM